MERLTTRNSEGIAVLKQPLECERCGDLQWTLPDLGSGSPTDRLAEYEDIGLLPEQIIEVDRLYAEKCKELAELQKNHQWIPCSERLPADCERVLVWYEYFRYGDYNRMFQTYGIGFQVKGQWCGDVWGGAARCIAWQPLPEAYHEPIEDNKCLDNCQEAAGV